MKTTWLPDLIHNVGPGGNFLTEEHTCKYLRKEIYFPEFGLRKEYSSWVSEGKLTAVDLVLEKAIKILKEHKPLPINNDKKEKIAAVVKRAEARQRRK
ncbi:MAG: trimethylamine methyltransferase family protein [Dehalobacterium sp.]